MDSLTLGLLIIGSIGAIGLLQLIAWTVVVVRNPNFDFLQPEPQAKVYDQLNAPSAASK